MVRSLEQMTMRKVYLRILPFAALTYFFCYLDASMSALPR